MSQCNFLLRSICWENSLYSSWFRIQLFAKESVNKEEVKEALSINMEETIMA